MEQKMKKTAIFALAAAFLLILTPELINGAINFSDYRLPGPIYP